MHHVHVKSFHVGGSSTYPRHSPPAPFQHPMQAQVPHPPALYASLQYEPLRLYQYAYRLLLSCLRLGLSTQNPPRSRSLRDSGGPLGNSMGSGKRPNAVFWKLCVSSMGVTLLVVLVLALAQHVACFQCMGLKLLVVERRRLSGMSTDANTNVDTTSFNKNQLEFMESDLCVSVNEQNEEVQSVPKNDSHIFNTDPPREELHTPSQPSSSSRTASCCCSSAPLTRSPSWKCGPTAAAATPSWACVQRRWTPSTTYGEAV